MPCLLEKTAVHCSECQKPLSGGRDTFGTIEAPLCLNCRFVVDDRAVEEKRGRLKFLYTEGQSVEDDISRLRTELLEAENSAWEIARDTKRLEDEFGLTHSEGVALCA